MSGIVDQSNIASNEWKDRSIPQPDIVAAQDAKFVKYPAGKYDLSNPHPGYGIDPNILNEYGHTRYPKWVDGVVVNSEAEEKALTGKEVEPNPAVKDSPWK